MGPRKNGESCTDHCFLDRDVTSTTQTVASVPSPGICSRFPVILISQTGPFMFSAYWSTDSDWETLETFQQDGWVEPIKKACFDWQRRLYRWIAAVSCRKRPCCSRGPDELGRMVLSCWNDFLHRGICGVLRGSDIRLTKRKIDASENHVRHEKRCKDCPLFSAVLSCGALLAEKITCKGDISLLNHQSKDVVNPI